MSQPFNEEDLDSLVNALTALGAVSEQAAKLPGDIIKVLKSPKDRRLKIWLSDLRLPFPDQDQAILAPKVSWNDTLEMWLVAARELVGAATESVQAKSKSTVSRKTAAKSKSNQRGATKGSKKTEHPTKKKVKAKAVLPDKTLSDMVVIIKREFDLAAKVTMIEAILEAEKQLNVDARGANVKQRAQTIISLVQPLV